MKSTIKLNKTLISVWKKELTNKSDCAKKAKVGRWTISQAIKTGRCTESVMNRINVYLLRQREQRREKLLRVISGRD